MYNNLDRNSIATKLWNFYLNNTKLRYTRAYPSLVLNLRRMFGLDMRHEFIFLKCTISTEATFELSIAQVNESMVSHILSNERIVVTRNTHVSVLLWFRPIHVRTCLTMF
uniref:Uncharacterized protein n=1 Tax=Cacopsylla melanoneura TaxID=428564 RepID=A0A8D8ZJT6_9HEMI